MRSGKSTGNTCIHCVVHSPGSPSPPNTRCLASSCMIAARSILSRVRRSSSGRVLRAIIVSASASLENVGSGVGCIGAKIWRQLGQGIAPTFMVLSMPLTARSGSVGCCSTTDVSLVAGKSHHSQRCHHLPRSPRACQCPCPTRKSCRRHCQTPPCQILLRESCLQSAEAVESTHNP